MLFDFYNDKEVLDLNFKLSDVLNIIQSDSFNEWFEKLDGERNVYIYNK